MVFSPVETRISWALYPPILKLEINIKFFDDTWNKIMRHRMFNWILNYQIIKKKPISQIQNLFEVFCVFPLKTILSSKCNKIITIHCYTFNISLIFSWPQSCLVDAVLLIVNLNGYFFMLLYFYQWKLNVLVSHIKINNYILIYIYKNKILSLTVGWNVSILFFLADFKQFSTRTECPKAYLLSILTSWTVNLKVQCLGSRYLFPSAQTPSKKRPGSRLPASLDKV